VKVCRLFSAILIAISMLSVNKITALAVPPLPSSFYGTVKVNGSNVSVGTIVSAWINGVQYAYTESLLYQGDSVYALDIPGDDPATIAIEGGAPGDTVEFRVNGRTTQQNAAWQTGTNIMLNLSLTVVNSPPVITEGDSVMVVMSKDGLPMPFDLTLNATDSDAGDILTWGIAQTPNHGIATATGTGNSKAIHYSPAPGYVGSDSFVVQVSDGYLGVDMITVNVEILQSYFSYAPLIFR
jgi:hypothetical protein